MFMIQTGSNYVLSLSVDKFSPAFNNLKSGILYYYRVRWLCGCEHWKLWKATYIDSYRSLCLFEKNKVH